MELGNKKAKSFVLIMVGIALVSFLLRFTIKKTIDVVCVQNEGLAAATLKSIAVALDNYARDNKGVYPVSFSLLISANPSYLDRDYIAESPIKGYTYTCSRMDASGYNCYSFPSRCALTGRVAFTATTGNILISEDCKKKE